MGFRSLPQVLWSNLAATVHVRARKVVIGSNMTLTDSGQGVVTIASTGGGASALDDLTDVVLTSPSNGQVLKYDGAEWINDTDATGGGSSGIITVANGPGSATIPALSPVYWYDQDGAGHLSVATLTGSDPTKVLLGLLLEDLTVGGTAQCQTEGLVENIDTSGFSVGAYLFASTTGTLTASTAGLTIRHLVGLVLESNATTGKLQLSDIGSNLDSKPRHGHYGYNDGGPLEHAQFNEFDLSALATPPAGQHVVGVHIGTSHWSRLDSAGIVHDLEAGGGGSGTVTSVAATVPTGFSVSGSPVTTSGTLGITLDSQTANKVLASATSGGTATPAFRALVAADIPAIAESGVTSLVTDLGLKAPIASPTFTGITTAPEYSASGLTGATAASRYVGATTSGAPVSGTFSVGDWAPDQTGKRWTCTVGGSPGTWVQEPGTGGGGLYSAYLNYQDQKTTGTDGGTFTSGAWRTRDLNTEVADTGNHGSVASNQITLAAGTYVVRALATGFQIARNQLRIQNITDSATLCTGISELTQGSTAAHAAQLADRFTISGSKVLELQHQCESTQGTFGFGTACSFSGSHETYAIVELWKEA